MRRGLRPRGSGRILGRRGLGLCCLGDWGVGAVARAVGQDGEWMHYKVGLVQRCCCCGWCSSPKICSEEGTCHHARD